MKLFQNIKRFFATLFQKRNIIIMSERSTAHMSMSGKLQFLLLLGAVAVVSVGSFSTGKFMAAQRVIDQQGETIKSVANARIEDNFDYSVPSLTSKKFSKADEDAAELDYNFSSMDQEQLISRISLLEKRIQELKQTNEEIVNVVRTTADGQIKDLENVIRQTGLSPELLKRQAEQEQKIRRKPTASNVSDGTGGKGGPYIPNSWDSDMRSFVEDLDKSADRLYVLRRILDIMPTAAPIKNASRESPFGRRVDPFTNRIAFHAGMDLASRSSPQILAPSDGKVSFAGWMNGYGNMIEIEHGLGISTRYGHLSKINVSEDQVVKEGQIIGVQGSTGRSTGAHLHYEVRFNNRPINPAPFINAGQKYVSQN
jgi:murein DD-endopeptidase MepM/ murein hydrolase activator NlpD